MNTLFATASKEVFSDFERSTSISMIDLGHCFTMEMRSSRGILAFMFLIVKLNPVYLL